MPVLRVHGPHVEKQCFTATAGGGQGPAYLQLFPLDTEHHPSSHYPFRWGLRERKGSRAGKSKPNRSARAQPPRQGHLPRGEALCPRLPEALLLPSWPAASFQVQSFSPFLVASLATFKFHPWGQGQMSAWVLTKAFLCGAIICSEDFRANGTGLS